MRFIPSPTTAFANQLLQLNTRLDRKLKKPESFLQEHRAEITLYESARDALRELSGGEKLPTMKSLRDKKYRLTVNKNKEYETYRSAQDKPKELQTAYTNATQMLGIMKT